MSSQAPAEEPATAAELSSPSSRTLRMSLRLIVVRVGFSLLIGLFFVWLMRVGDMRLLPSRSAFAAVRWWTVPAYLALWSAVHLLRAARWKLLLAPLASVPMGRVFSASFVGYLAILVLPLRTGEFVRPLLIRREAGVSGWAAAGTIGAERIVDGLMLSLLLFAGLQLATPLDPLPDRIGGLPISARVIPQAAYVALAIFALAFVAMGIGYRWQGLAVGFIRWSLGWLSARFAEGVATKFLSVTQGLQFLSKKRFGIPFLAVTAAYWLLNAAGTLLIGWGAGLDAFTYVEACVVMGVLALGILVPNAPGFFGAFQVSLYAALALFFPSSDVLGGGSAFVFLMYASQVLITVLFALGASMTPTSRQRLWALLRGGA